MADFAHILQLLLRKGLDSGGVDFAVETGDSIAAANKHASPEDNDQNDPAVVACVCHLLWFFLKFVALSGVLVDLGGERSLCSR
jgi:hypothetical protein